MQAKTAVRNVKSGARSGWSAVALLTLTLSGCTRTDGTTPKPHGEAAAPAAEGSKKSDWRENRELERALEHAAFKKDAAENLSDAAVLRLGDQAFLVVVSDEGHDFAVTTLGKEGESKIYDLADLPRQGLTIELPSPGSKVEVDIEAVTTAGDRVFLIGSASLKRKKPKQGDHSGKRLEEIVPASGAGADYSNYVYELVARAGSGDFPDFELVGARDARELLLGLPLVATFKDVPSKDNGLDVEGAVVHGDYFYFGLRGPVLRGRALVVRTRRDFSGAEPYTLDLGGLGVRALTYAGGGDKAGLYILAGPTLERTDEFVLYRFAIGEKSPSDVRTSDLVSVASVPSTDKKRPEGLFELGSELCVLSDGVVGGAPRCRAY
jgi:hypothetical protein